METSPLRNGLTVLFEDGLEISFKQDELITSLAEQHQATPCEYQILQALCKKRDEAVALGEWNASWADALLDSVLCEQSSLPTFALDSHAEETTGSGDLLIHLYSLDTHVRNTNGGQLLLLLRIRDDGGEVTRNNNLISQVKEVYERQGIPVMRESPTRESVQDMEAATVTMLQHFIYQGRLFAALERVSSKQAKTSSDKKRHRTKDKKARKECKKCKKDKKQSI